ncbi:hypothetical protein MNB_SV-3-219 [hydrothermal vent metagenome]|uniref:Uncharacterized protein n=1 Tax=hydrothermal vent metagenome TaxID=652676 RepID=A0A1W1BJD8_9ZZZZ
MCTRENETRKQSFRFKSEEIILAVKMIEKLEKTIEVVYYLMNHEEEESFVLLLMKADNVNLKKIVEDEKRDTDIFFEIDKDKSLYAVLCQDTKVDGGYHFAQRIMEQGISQNSTTFYCAEIEVRSTHYSIKKVIFKLIETFIKAQIENKTNEIVYKSLN